VVGTAALIGHLCLLELATAGGLTSKVADSASSATAAKLSDLGLALLYPAVGVLQTRALRFVSAKATGQG
jgi:hypothetical protein